ncbi:MAG: biotin-dependent carboxyltransferase [Chloroflexi bacterium]|nr:biotin-dependent carboxyltransferase [Chloroflexota bacterium]
MALEVRRPGLLTTVQDMGRYGYQKYGVPVAGAMDPFALQAANALVGNPLGAAALEITLVGPTLRAQEACTIAVAGGDLTPLLDGQPVPMWKAVAVPKGGAITFGGRRSGFRAYLAVAGGLAVPLVLGSRSTFLRGGFGGLEGRALKAGDRLPVGPTRAPVDGGRAMPVGDRPPYGDDVTVRVVLGPQDSYFTHEGLDRFLGSVYMVSPASDRMGYRLQGPEVTHRERTQIISDGLPLGAVQVPPDRQPIVMMADHQTTGGYPKIGTVIAADIPLLAQCMPGLSQVCFAAVTLAEAQAAYRAMAAAMANCSEPDDDILWGPC